MSTNLPQLSSNELSGKVDELKPTILKRGVLDITLNIAHTTGYHGVATVYLDDVTNNQQVGLLECAVSVDVTLAGTALTKLPTVFYAFDETVDFSGGFTTAYLEGSGYTRQTLTIWYHSRTASDGDIVRAYYKVYSEAALTQSWGYKSS